MSYGYPYGQPQPGGVPPPGGAGYPPQPQGYGGYPPQQGGGYPPAPGGYPPAPGGSYPPAPGGSSYPPVPGGSGYPPAPGGYPPSGAPGGYPPAPGQSAGLGFEGMASGPQQPPSQNYGAPPAQYGAPGYPPAAGYPPPGGYQQPPAGGYQQAANASYQQPAYGAPPPASYQAPGYGAHPHYGYPPSTYNNYRAGKMSDRHLAAGMAAMSIATHGTVKAISPFNAEEDAKILRKAMKGLGTDEKAIINVIGYRSNKQRQDIILAYKQAFGKDLIKDLKSELGGNFEDLVKAMMMKPRYFDAYCLHRAMSGIGTNEATLIEIMVTRTNAEIKEIKEIYKKEYKKDLERELRSETSGHFSRLLVSMCNAARNESPQVDQGKAQADANALYQAGEKKWGTDESTFNMIMCSRSIPQLRATFIAYQKIANRDIAKSIGGEFSGDIEDGLKAVVESARNTPAYFADRLYKSMSGAGTNDNALIRIIVSRCEVDMVEIKQEFQKMFKQPLPGFISGDTSGDYKKLLLALVGA